MFYTDVLLSKHGSLANVWLAAHWEKKLTKDHVFRCNIEKTIGKIISHKVKFSLRTSGHLLLGVVRIYKRKMKYLWEDCNETAGKMSMTFRPGLSDLSTGDLEASYSAITLEEEFYDFDMDTINTIDASEHLTQNQSRPEEITLKEYYAEGSHILRGHSFEERYTLPNCSVYISDYSTGNLLGENSLMCNSGDGFGDEGASETMMDFLWKADENCLLEDMPLEETLPLTPESHQAKPDSSAGSCFNSDDICFPKIEEMDTTTLTTEQEGFILHPIDTSGTSGKRMRKKRRLLIDPVKELSNKSICEQLSSFEDTLKPLEFVPPTRNLMMLKERDKVSTLLSTPFQHLDSDQLNKLFPTWLLCSGFKSGRSVKRDLEGNEVNCYNDDTSMMEEPNPQEHLNRKRVTKEPKDLSPKNTMELWNRKENPEAVKMSAVVCHMVLTTLQEYNKMGIWSFSLKELCKNCNPKQVAATFNSLLLLKKKQSIELSQSSPYADIIITVGPRFHDV